MPKNILYVHYGDDWLRGSERCVLDLMNHINRDHFHPILWCNSDVMIEAAKKVKIRTYQSDFKKVTLNGNSLHKLLGVYRLVLKAIHLIRAHNIKLIHVNSVAPCRWMSLAAMLTRTPIIGHYHTQYQTRERFSSLSHWVDAVIGVSRDVIKPYQSDGCNRTNCEVIYNGVDHEVLSSAEKLDLAEMYGIESSDFSLLSVGSLIKRKGYHDLIYAVKELVDRGNSVKCVIVGGGPEEQPLRLLVDSLALRNHVFLAGQRYDVASFYNSDFDSFISASTSEAFGLVNVEAAFCNKAVIAPDVDGLNEIFTAGSSAELFASNAPAVMADSIERLILDSAYRMHLQKHGNLVAHEKFTIKRYVQQFETLYDRFLQTRLRTKPALIGYIKSLLNAWHKRSSSVVLDSQGS